VTQAAIPGLSPEQQERAHLTDKQAECLALHLRGASYRFIAIKLGYVEHSTLTATCRWPCGRSSGRCVSRIRTRTTSPSRCVPGYTRSPSASTPSPPDAARPERRAHRPGGTAQPVRAARARGPQDHPPAGRDGARGRPAAADRTGDPGRGSRQDPRTAGGRRPWLARRSDQGHAPARRRARRRREVVDARQPVPGSRRRVARHTARGRADGERGRSRDRAPAARAGRVAAESGQALAGR
jgi:hypothetical protein